MLQKFQVLSQAKVRDYSDLLVVSLLTQSLYRDVPLLDQHTLPAAVYCLCSREGPGRHAATSRCVFRSIGMYYP